MAPDPGDLGLVLSLSSGGTIFKDIVGVPFHWTAIGLASNTFDFFLGLPVFLSRIRIFFVFFKNLSALALAS